MSGTLPITPVLIGRPREVEMLDRTLAEAREGRGSCVLIAGDAGVGKTRMLAEASRLAISNGFLVLQGACFEQDNSFPYAPVIDALRALFARRSPAELEHLLGPFGPEIIKLVPELQLVLPELQPTAPLDPESEKRRLFESLTRFLARLAGIQPVLVILEDLHWSDDLSLDFLHLLARRSTTQRLLLLASHRPDEASPQLTRLLAEFDRTRVAHDIVLAPLTRANVDAMVRAILDLDAASPSDLLDPLYGLTEGNPFQVEEVVKSLIDTGALVHEGGRWRLSREKPNVPRSVRDAVQRRTSQLDDMVLNVLTHAAVAGRRFEFDLLREVTQLTEVEVLRAIESLIAEQLVVEETADRFAFRHALTREAVYAMVLARQRQALHRGVAQALERLHADEPDRYAADFGYHYYAAEEWGPAHEWSRRAGYRAQAMYAPRAAIDHYNRALDAADYAAQPMPTDVLLARARAYETTGYFEAAREDIECALEVSRTNRDRSTEWQGLIALGRLWASRDYARTGSHFERALEVARALDDPATIAYSLNRLGNWHANVAQPAQALAHHHEALDLLNELHDRRGIVETLDLIGMACQLNGNQVEAHDAFTRAIALWRELGDQRGLAATLASVPLCSPCYMHQTDAPAIGLGDAISAGEEGLAIAREIGWRAGEAYALLNLAMTFGPLGDYERAFDAARAARACSEEIEHRQWLCGSLAVAGMLYHHVLDHASAISNLEQAVEMAGAMGSRVWFDSSRGVLAAAYVQHGMQARAEALLAEAAPDPTPMQTHGQRLCWLGRLELAIGQSMYHEAARIAEALCAPAAGSPDVDRLLGIALTRTDRAKQAVDVLEAARSIAIAQERRPALWRLHIALGSAYRAVGRRAESAASFGAARELIDGLAHGIDDDAVRENFIARATAMLPRARAPSAARVEKEKYGGLTAKQREVAVLIARGRSNREIANRLGVGVRTVETHVTQTLARLAFKSRAQIAVWATETGLARETPSADAQ